MIQISSQIRKRSFICLLLFVLCCVVCFSFYDGTISNDNFNYGLEQVNTYDPSVFSGNISVTDSATSPRRFSNMFTAWLMSFVGGDWFEAAVLIIRSNYLLYGAAIAFLAYSMAPKHKPFMAVLLAASIMAGSLPSLSFDINGAIDMFLGTGIPLAMIGITFALKREKNWDAAWLFATLAALMHIHEGIWGGFMIGVIWLTTSLADGKIRWKELRAIPVYVVVLLIICIPSILGDEAVDPAAFLQIYVFWRTPHHFLLSSWGIEKIALSSFFTLFPFIAGILKVFPQRSEPQPRRSLFLFSGMVILWWGLLAIEYFCTEIIASSLLITLFVPKCIKFVVFVSYTAYLELAYRAYAQKHYLQFFLVIASLVVAREWAAGMIVLYLVCWFTKIDGRLNIGQNKNAKILLIYTLLAILLLLALQPLQLPTPIKWFCGVLPFAELLEFCPVTRVRQMSSAIVAAGVLLIGCFSMEGRIWRIGESGMEWISGQESMRTTAGDEIYDLAIDFQNQTDVGTEFLADPYSNIANEVQIISQRNCCCIYKNMPSSKKGVMEWYQRIMRVEDLSECTDIELLELMQDLGIKYVLVTDDQMTKLQQSSLFTVVSKTENTGIYKLE